MDTIIFERRGGIAGMDQRLEIAQGTQASVLNKGQKVKTWVMSASEAAAFAALVKSTQQAPLPRQSPEADTTSDTFEYRVFVGQSAKPTIALRSVTMTPSDGTAWGNLMAYCDGVLTQNLAGRSVDLVDPSLLR